MRRHLAVLLLTAASLWLPGVLHAQEPAPAQQTDTVRTPQQRALDRLRSLNGVGQADTVRQPVDTVRAEQVNIVAPASPNAARPVTPPPSKIERDSIMNTLLAGVPAYIATEYQGDTVRFQAEGGRLELRGSPQVAREGNQLVADSLIVYDERSARACGYGSPVLHATAMTHPLASDTVCFDVQRQVGWARGAQTTFSEGATWNLRGETLVVDGNDYYSHRAIFTDCDLPWPHQHYHFGAREVKVVRDNVLVARDVTLNFQDVPVFWLPFMVQSLSQGRRSGLLMPRFGINDIVRQGTRYSRRIEDVGVYWAVNDYMGAELAMDWVSDNWTGLRGSFDYNFADRFLNGRATYRQFWKREGGREFTLTSGNSWQVDERTRIGLTANYTTSSAFVRQRTIDPRELNRSIDSHGSFTRRFDFGNLTLGASRRQYLSDNTVTMVLPSASLTFVPVTLFAADPGEERWYSNATWSGSTDVRLDRYSVGENSPNRQAQDRQQITTSAQSGFTIGRFSWNQSVGFDEQRRDARTVLPDPSRPTTPQDTLFLPDAVDQRGRWNTSLNFQQRLIGTSTFTPGLALGGEFVRNERSEGQLVSSPTRIDFNASLNTELFGFWPGFAGFERFRHRLSPSISYSYSPAGRASPQQQAVFAIDTIVGLRERNRLMIGLSQTFEGRRRAEVTEDTAAADTAQADATGEPRRRTQVQPIKLLSLTTSALVYDFVRARDLGQGVETTQIASTVQSDLIRGLQLSFAHDLFEPLERTLLFPGSYRLSSTGVPQSTIGRRFAPHLSSVNASFSLNSSSWLFRLLRLGAGEPETGGADPLQPEDPMGAGPPIDRTQTELGGMVGTSRRTERAGPRSAVGTWNANFTYSLMRPRASQVGGRENQMMTTGLTFQATENWGVRWDTSYSFTTGAFADHILTLTRTLHDWDANFDFVRAQNGNFQFQFRVHLRANPDIKFDYHQSDSPAVRQAQGQL